MNNCVFGLLQPLFGSDNTKLEFVQMLSGTNVPRHFVPSIEKVGHFRHQGID